MAISGELGISALLGSCPFKHHYLGSFLKPSKVCISPFILHQALSNPPELAAKYFKFHALSNWVSRVSSNFLMHCWPFANLVANLVFYACWGCFLCILSSACCSSVYLFFYCQCMKINTESSNYSNLGKIC